MNLTVVCPLNGQPNAERALRHAIDAAAHARASVELFSAVEDAHMVNRRHSYLKQVAAQHQTAGTEFAFEVVVNAHAPRAIAERSASPDVLTVMATSSQPLMHIGYVGSAAERVTRDSHNPTLLIGPHNETRLGDVDRVVAPCDGSKLSEEILVEAREWADRLDVDLWVVTSLSRRDTKRDGYDPDTEAAYLRRLATQIDAQWEILHGPDPANSIVQFAGSGLITMTTHGRSGLSRITVGSVTSGVTRWAMAPVLVANSRKSIGLGT